MVTAPLYTREILRLAASLGEPVVLTRVDGAGERRSRACGSVVAVAVMVDGGRVGGVARLGRRRRR